MRITPIILTLLIFTFGELSQPLFAQPILIPSPITGDQKINFILLQVNDIYEITPVSEEGGIARLATLKKQLLAENPNTYLILAGDTFSPSALGTAKVNGAQLNGRQMIDTLNRAGLDFATLGNHEFDLKEEEFKQRLQESTALWVISNVTDPQGKLFPNTVANHILTVIDTDQETAKIGLFGLVLPSNPRNYVKYQDILTVAAQQTAELNSQVNMTIAITHLSVDQDCQLANQQPEIDLILGGHEHQNMAVETGENQPKIYKADANARTAYIHRITYHLDTQKIEIQSELKHLTADIPPDPQVAQAVNEWVKIAYEGFHKEGFEPEKVIAEIPISLNGLERKVRNHSTELTELLAETMRLAIPDTEIAFFNSGAIRIDDILLPGKLTQYDIIRILPFGGIIVAIDIKGNLLKQVLEIGQANAGNGGYLQTAGIALIDNQWLINDQPLDPNRIYRAAVNNFLLTGKEVGLDFFNRTHPDLKILIEGPDLRQTFIAELQKRYNFLKNYDRI